VAAVREIPLPGEGACPSRDSGHWRRADRRTGDTRPNQRAPPDASGRWGGPALKMRSNISCTDSLGRRAEGGAGPISAQSPDLVRKRDLRARPGAAPGRTHRGGAV